MSFSTAALSAFLVSCRSPDAGSGRFAFQVLLEPNIGDADTYPNQYKYCSALAPAYVLHNNPVLPDHGNFSSSICLIQTDTATSDGTWTGASWVPTEAPTPDIDWDAVEATGPTYVG